MNKIFIFLLMICMSATVYAQQLTVMSVNLRPQDARARTNPRDDANGKKCAIIRVGVVGIDDLVFPDAIGNVERSLSEYIVYVPDGLKLLRYKNKTGKNLGSINFEDYGLEINSLASYDVIFESTDRLRSAIFSIQPVNATLTFDGKNYDVNSDGIVMINKPVGEYSYTIMAEGYLGQSGTVTLTEDDISTVTNIILEQQLYPVTIKVFPEESTVFIDNVPYSNEQLSDLKLSIGRHLIRVTSANYKEKESYINVKSNIDPFCFVLKKNKEKTVKYKDERTRTSINVRNHWDLLLGAENYDIGEIGNSIDYTMRLYKTNHFGGLLTRQWGLTAGIPHKFQAQETEDMYYYAELSLGYGIAIPFGTYNQFLFSSILSGFGRYRFSDDEALAFGIHLSARLDISKFIIEVTGTYSPNYRNKFYPSLMLGYKFNI